MVKTSVAGPWPHPPSGVINGRGVVVAAVLTRAAEPWYESPMTLVDNEIRARVFSCLDLQVAIYGDEIPWKVLQSFELEGSRRHS